MIILGINCFGHDSAASFCFDGEIVFACEEERLNRKKHSGVLPIQSIKAGLEFLNLSWTDIDHITYSWNPWITYRSIPKYAARFFYRIPTLLREKKTFSMEENLGMLNYLKDIRQIPTALDKVFGVGKYRFHTLEHHATHAASAYYPSGLKDAAIVTIDGAGEWDTMTIQHGNELNIEKLISVRTPHSMGAVYLAVSVHLGFSRIEGPGKLMGLASYGNRNSESYEKLKEVIKLGRDGKFNVDMRYFRYHYSRKHPVTSRFEREFGLRNETGSDWTEKQLDLAAAVQRRTEDVFLHIAGAASRITGSKNLVLAGGVALNSVSNGVIVKSNLFDQVFIQPAAGDSGTSSGGPLYLYHKILKFENPIAWKHVYLGPEYTENQILKSLELNELTYLKLDEESLCGKVAQLLAAGKIVAWFQGRMEFGPRALGNRSFLASPLLTNMKDVLNARVKFREGFRPFAGAFLEEDQHKYVDLSVENPYMLVVANVKPEMRPIIPAITHVDGTVRIQTVNERENSRLYNLLNAFKSITGHGVILNTSFNIKGEPIVASPADAVSSFLRADVDALAIGNFLVIKR